MHLPRRLAALLSFVSIAAALGALLWLSPGARLPAHWDPHGGVDAWLPLRVGLSHVPGLIACLALLAWLLGGAWPRVLFGAVAALSAFFLYALGVAFGLGAPSYVAPGLVAALFCAACALELWRPGGPRPDDVRDG